MPKPNTPKLNDTQLVILSSASQREDGLASAPEDVKGAAAKRARSRASFAGSWATSSERAPPLHRLAHRPTSWARRFSPRRVMPNT